MVNLVWFIIGYLLFKLVPNIDREVTKRLTIFYILTLEVATPKKLRNDAMIRSIRLKKDQAYPLKIITLNLLKRLNLKILKNIWSVTLK